MPRITITENEDLSLGQLSAIENVVLVPLFVDKYPVDDNGKDIIEPIKFTSYLDFEKMFEGCVAQGKDDNEKVEIYDKSYYYALELLGMGLHVVVDSIAPEENSEGEAEWHFGEDSEKTIDEEIELKLNELINAGEFDKFIDRNIYNIKFITTGAHANWGPGDSENWCFVRLARVARERCDALALIELVDIDLRNEEFLRNVANEESAEYINILAPITKIESRFSSEYFDRLGKIFENSACFYPHGIYQMNFSGNIGEDIKMEMPASFGYLMAFAYSIQVNEDWFAASGVDRGFIPNLVGLNYPVGDSFMHVLQGDEYGWKDYDGNPKFYPIRINPIMFKGAYGNRVWGNRVFSWYQNDQINALNQMNISYREYLNVRMLLCDIKKQIYGAATRVTFEPNDDITWINFKGLVNNLLDRMQTGRGLEWYSWEKEYTSKKATIKATLWVKPIEAVEYFDINIQLTDQDAVVVESNDNI